MKKTNAATASSLFYFDTFFRYYRKFYFDARGRSAVRT